MSPCVAKNHGMTSVQGLGCSALAQGKLSRCTDTQRSQSQAMHAAVTSMKIVMARTRLGVTRLCFHIRVQIR